MRPAVGGDDQLLDAPLPEGRVPIKRQVLGGVCRNDARYWRCRWPPALDPSGAADLERHVTLPVVARIPARHRRATGHRVGGIAQRHAPGAIKPMWPLASATTMFCMGPT